MKPRKPLFSRRQLNLIIIVCVAAIALLSLDPNPWPELQRQQLHNVSVTYTNSPDQQSRLQLSFALPNPGIDAEPAAKLLAELLHLRFQSHDGLSSWQLSLQPDRLTLIQPSIAPSAQQDRQLQQLVELLTRPFEPAIIDEAIRRAQARRHLNRNQPNLREQADTLLRNPQHQSPADPTAMNQLQQQLFSRAQLRIALLGQEPVQQLAALNALIEPLPPGQPWPSVSEPFDANAPALQRTANIALQSLPGRQQPEFGQALLLSRILAELSPVTITQISGAEHSWRLWDLQLETNATARSRLDATLSAIQQRIAQQKDWELRHHADQLREQLQHRTEASDTLMPLLDTIAFYQLPLDYLPSFEAKIAAFDGAQLRILLQQALQHDSFIAP